MNGIFRQIKVRHISEEVFDQIKSAIIEGKLKPGEKLPTEKELMNALGVSRVPIREALKLLANMGFVETRQGGGTYVKAILTERVKDPLNYIIEEDEEKLFDLLEVRMEIETMSAYYAAQRATEEEIASLERIIEETKAYVEKGRKPPTTLDANFHIVLAQCSHNVIRAHLLHTIYEIFSGYFNYLIENICFSQKYILAIYEQHREIYNAISSHNPEKARYAAAKHLSFVGEELKKQTLAKAGAGNTNKRNIKDLTKVDMKINQGV
ncbi:MAG: FadR family transcriptional regulator [Syntrophorhabdaceae bacterium]|nr:FadR family transcriptional regulator [Syntrophorhabdaceae bacterium]